MLCPTHHKVIDSDLEAYSVERLQQMKRTHEAKHMGGEEPSDKVAQQFIVKLLRDIHSAIVGGGRAAEAGLSHTEMFEQQRTNWSGTLLTEISGRGHWELTVHPTSFNSALIPRGALLSLMQRCKVNQASWFFPLLIPGQEHSRGVDWVGDECERVLTAPEAWRLYRSGQFLDKWGFWDDWKDRTLGTPPQGWIPGQFLELKTTVVIPVMALLFAARLAASNEFQKADNIYISVKASGLRGRALYMAGGTTIWSQRICSENESFTEFVLSREDLVRDYREHALEVSEQVFWLFNFEMDQERLLEMQSEVIPKQGLWD
jgi:hypothetical protein